MKCSNVQDKVVKNFVSGRDEGKKVMHEKVLICNSFNNNKKCDVDQVSYKQTILTQITTDIEKKGK